MTTTLPENNPTTSSTEALPSLSIKTKIGNALCKAGNFIMFPGILICMPFLVCFGFGKPVLGMNKIEQFVLGIIGIPLSMLGLPFILLGRLIEKIGEVMQ